MATTPQRFPSSVSVAAHATVTQPLQGVFLLRMENAPDNRLTPDFIQNSLLPALDYVETEYYKACERGDKGGSLVLTGESGKGKFFSNGLQLELVKPGFWKNQYYKLLSRLLTFPLSTIAAVNGHAWAGGLTLALACDWRICRPDRTSMSMNELHFGAPLPAGMASVLSLRLPTPTLAKTMLTAHRYDPKEALKDGLVDEIVEIGDGSEKCIERALEEGDRRKGFAESGVLVAMKRTLYASTLAQLEKDEPADLFQSVVQEREDRMKALIAAAAGHAKL
ncbi:enoyl-CoA hydratase/isomerase family protein [Sporobolomyces salmoneus]|uniref:enoyl-CoA hydratase/isomerase family protein n=1 Tax=Sporobolomyces salmoneus TaxID=183962 RepID=UPI00317DDD7E